MKGNDEERAALVSTIDTYRDRLTSFVEDICQEHSIEYLEMSDDLEAIRARTAIDNFQRSASCFALFGASTDSEA